MGLLWYYVRKVVSILYVKAKVKIFYYIFGLVNVFFFNVPRIWKRSPRSISLGTFPNVFIHLTFEYVVGRVADSQSTKLNFWRYGQPLTSADSTNHWWKQCFSSVVGNLRLGMQKYCFWSMVSWIWGCETWRHKGPTIFIKNKFTY